MCQHMEAEGLEFLQFSFRWVNCLLLREIPFHLGLRLWDTYLAEGPRMKEFLIYVLAAFLLTWEKDLKQMDFQVSNAISCCGTCQLRQLKLGMFGADLAAQLSVPNVVMGFVH